MRGSAARRIRGEGLAPCCWRMRWRCCGRIAPMRISQLYLLLNRIFLILLFLCPALQAQTPNAYVSGTVTDPSGAIIPQADITLNDSKHPTLTTKTDAQGAFRLVDVLPGIYTITAN